MKIDTIARCLSFSPGEVLSLYLSGPGKQIALLALRALRYNSHAQKFEKRHARYLIWRWRIAAKELGYFNPYRIETLVNAIRLPVDERFPLRTRERLEGALDTLAKDDVIGGYHYKKWDEKPGYNWLLDWLNASVLIEPPELIVDTYQSIAGPVSGDTDLAYRLREKRNAENLSRMRAAEEIGITPDELLDVEMGKPPGTLRGKCESWLHKSVAS